MYVPHGIDTELWKPPEDKNEVRKKLGLDEDDFVIGVNAANNDAIRKAAPEMMLAFAKFYADHPDAILAMHAGVHQEGGQNLEVIAENLGITDRVWSWISTGIRREWFPEDLRGLVRGD